MSLKKDEIPKKILGDITNTALYNTRNNKRTFGEAGVTETVLETNRNSAKGTKILKATHHSSKDEKSSKDTHANSKSKTIIVIDDDQKSPATAGSNIAGASPDTHQKAKLSKETHCRNSLVLDSFEPNLLYYTSKTMVTWMKQREDFYNPKSNYFSWQSEVKPRMRAILIDWLYELAAEYNLFRETIHLSINYIDRFLSLVPNLPKERLQLLGVSSLLLAMKLEEYTPLKVDQLAMLTDYSYTSQQINSMERLVAQKLEWSLLPPTVYSFLKLFITRKLKLESRYNSESIADNNTNSKILANFPKMEFLKMMQLADYFIMLPSYLNYPPSLIAATLFHNVNELKDGAIEKITGYSPHEIVNCSREITAIQRDISPLAVYRQPEEFLPLNFHENQMHNPRAINIITNLLKQHANKAIENK